MTIKRIKYYIVFIILFFCGVKLAYANIIINEFVSHPNSNEKEWVEIRNTTPETPVNLSGWKLTELSSPSTANQKENDLISLTGIINDILVFEVGTTKLNDTGDSIGLYNGTTPIDRVTYGTESTVKDYSIELTAPSIGKSGALISGSWLANQDPTKNLLNSDNDTNNDTTEDINNIDNSSSSSSSSSSKEVPEILKITTKIISPKVVVAGIPFSFSSLTTTNRGETYAVGNYVWNFGDGMTSKIKESGPFDYLYEYPGDYIVTLSYFDSVLNKEADTTNKINIKVIPSEISISSVGNDKDPFIEIENKSKYEITLSNWIITGGIHYFIIPFGTTILPSKKIKLSPKISGFVGDDLHFITIANQDKELIATYPIQTERLIQKSSPMVKVVNTNTNSVNDTTKDSQVINLNDLGASAEKSKVNIPNFAYPLLGLSGIIGVGIIGILTIKRKNNISDYVEKEIRAEDMTIIE